MLSLPVCAGWLRRAARFSPRARSTSVHHADDLVSPDTDRMYSRQLRLRQRRRETHATDQATTALLFTLRRVFRCHVSGESAAARRLARRGCVSLPGAAGGDGFAVGGFVDAGDVGRDELAAFFVAVEGGAGHDALALVDFVGHARRLGAGGFAFADFLAAGAARGGTGGRRREAEKQNADEKESHRRHASPDVIPAPPAESGLRGRVHVTLC